MKVNCPPQAMQTYQRCCVAKHRGMCSFGLAKRKAARCWCSFSGFETFEFYTLGKPCGSDILANVVSCFVWPRSPRPMLCKRGKQAIQHKLWGMGKTAMHNEACNWKSAISRGVCWECSTCLVQRCMGTLNTNVMKLCERILGIPRTGPVSCDCSSIHLLYLLQSAFGPFLRGISNH